MPRPIPRPVLTEVGGRIVHADGPFAPLAPPLPPASPDWLPVGVYGASADSAPSAQRVVTSRYGVAHNLTEQEPLWGHPGCACFAF